MGQDLLQFTQEGIYCAAGDFYIDPWRRVDRAVVTHAHSDHARWGMGSYLAHKDSVPILKLRLGANIMVQGVAYGEETYINGVKISLHPAGHIIGSAQVRVEYKGEVWVASGDYKVEDDGISGCFEALPCHAFISETTFGLPVYRWPKQEQVMADINSWWADNAQDGKATLLIGYALGKAQRLLEGLDRSIGPVFTHGAVENVNQAFRQHGIALQPTQLVTPEHKKADFKGAIIVAPGSAIGSPWARRFGDYSLGMASGWMNLRGARRRRAADRGFVLSDHADWDGLNKAIAATGAERVILTHGYTHNFARWLNEQGLKAYVEETLFEGELNEIQESNTPAEQSTEES